MVSRKTARVIAETYEEEFAYSNPMSYSSSGTHGYETTIYTHQLYDFLYDNDYPAWLLYQARKLVSYPRAVQDWIMKLHTGETQYDATPNWSWDKRRQFGQQYLEELAERMRLEKPKPVFSALWASMRPMSTCWSKGYSPSPTAQRCKKSSPRRTAPSMSLRDCWTHQAELPRAYAPSGFSKQERKPHAL